MRALPSPLYGVTLDDVGSLNAIVTSLKSMSHMPIARIVFDEGQAASTYVTAVNQIQPVSYIMGELLDSLYVPQSSTSAYVARAKQYLDAFENKVDLWEVGNEINGEWVGDAATVSAKMAGAYDLVKARGKRAALTLYYNGDSDDGSNSCWEKKDNQMFNWAQANVPARMKEGLDYVLISFYEDDCAIRAPDWTTVFSQLGTMFPNAKIGFGEVGTEVASKKASYINRYYGMSIPVRNYVGGYFWWYFAQDGVPSTKSLWSTLNTMISRGPAPQAGRAGGWSMRDEEPITVLDRMTGLAFALTLALAILWILRMAGRTTVKATTRD